MKNILDIILGAGVWIVIATISCSVCWLLFPGISMLGSYICHHAICKGSVDGIDYWFNGLAAIILMILLGFVIYITLSTFAIAFRDTGASLRRVYNNERKKRNTSDK